MAQLEVAGLTIFFLVLFSGVFSILFGFPGTAIIFFASLLYALATGFEKVDLEIILILAVISTVSEIFDFYIGVKGATRFEASKKALAASIVGSMSGAALLTPFLLGFGMLLGAFIGGCVGVFSVEFVRQSRLRPAMKASTGGITGRVVGIFAKGFCAIAMMVIILSSIYS